MKFPTLYLYRLLLLAAIALSPLVAVAQDPAGEPDPPEPTMELSDIIALIEQQQRELAAQRALLESQSHQIADLTEELETIKSAPESTANTDAEKQLAAQQRQLASQAQKIDTLTRELDVLRAPPATKGQLADSAIDSAKATSTPLAITEKELDGPPISEQAQQAIETGNQVAKAQADDPTRVLLDEFKGAWRLPGTNAALRFGGFVKSAIVYNNDALQIKDRFIVGSVPVGVNETTGEEAQSSVTADQSRLSFDLRTPTDFGIMRAFIEGDFAGSDEAFRLRHAFGQWRRVVTGKTWTTFMDPDASPEEIDFEGLNGRINVRQAQIRVMPTFGEKYELQFSLEDPDPDIENGSGVSRTPDVVIAGRFYSNQRLHSKFALIGREIRGQSENGKVEKAFGWGASLGGSFTTPSFDPRDKMLFQINHGDGIGRYVNDLSSIGDYDGVFEPGTDEMELFDITSGYLSWQHWWGLNELRSNFTFGWVNVDNPSFAEDDAYKQTLRLSTNLIWSPIPRIDLGGEYLWGQRKNEDGEEGDATQLQIMAKYRF